MDVLLLQAVHLRHPAGGDVGVGGMHHQGDARLFQLPQLGLQLLIGVVADNKPRRKTAEIGEVQKLLALGEEPGLDLQGRHGHAVGQQQAAVADEHPTAVHPCGKALALLAGDALHGLQVLFVGDHPSENAGEGIIHAAQHAGGVQYRFVDGLLFKGPDAVQGDAAAGEQVAAPQQDAVGIAQLLHRVLVQQVGTPPPQRFIGAAQRHMAAQGGRQRRGDAQRRGKDGDRPKDGALGKEIFQHGHYNGGQYGNGRQHPADALGHAGFLQHGLGVRRQTGVIQRHRLFGLLRQAPGPFGQAALRQGAAGHGAQGGHGTAAFPLAGVFHQLAPGIKEEDEGGQRQEDIIPVLRQQVGLRRHKAALQKAGKNGKGHIGVVALAAGEQRQKAVAEGAAAAQGGKGGKPHHQPQAQVGGGRQCAGEQQVVHRRQRQIDDPCQHDEIDDEGNGKPPLLLFQRLHHRFGPLAGSGGLPQRRLWLGCGTAFGGGGGLFRLRRQPFLRLQLGLRLLRLLPPEFRLGLRGGGGRRFGPLQQLGRGRLLPFRLLAFRFLRGGLRPGKAGACGVQLAQQVLRGGRRPFARLGGTLLPGAFFLYFPQDIVHIVAVISHGIPPLSL